MHGCDDHAYKQHVVKLQIGRHPEELIQVGVGIREIDWSSFLSRIALLPSPRIVTRNTARPHRQQTFSATRNPRSFLSNQLHLALMHSLLVSSSNHKHRSYPHIVCCLSSPFFAQSSHITKDAFRPHTSSARLGSPLTSSSPLDGVEPHTSIFRCLCIYVYHSSW